MARGAIQAIETRYAGCKFRSRTEARWGVVFDALGEPWRYESEDFYVREPGGRAIRYLPDFWLPRLRVWVEVKGSEEALGEKWDLMYIAAHPRYGLPADPDGAPVPPDGAVSRLLVLGPVPRPKQSLSTRSGFLLFESHDGDVAIRRCDVLGNKTPVMWDTSTGDVCVPTGCLDLEGFDVDVVHRDLGARDQESRRINYAFTCGRSARFEHGEKPDVVPWLAGEPQPW